GDGRSPNDPALHCLLPSEAASLLVWRRDALRRVVVYIHDPFDRSSSHEIRVRANAYCCSTGRAPGTRTALSVQTYPPHRALRGGRHFRHPGQTDRAEAERSLEIGRAHV